MNRPGEPRCSHPLPLLAGGVLRTVLPRAEREEILADLSVEYGERIASRGALGARVWIWWQALASVPALLGGEWWRGMHGFESHANVLRPGGSSMASWITDVRFAFRRLRRRPLYALLTILTLALGVGGTAAVFGIARSVFLSPLPYRDEASIGLFWSMFNWTEEEFLYLRGTIPGFSDVALYMHHDATLDFSDAPARLIPGVSASSELFGVLGVRAALGRVFQVGDDALGAEPVVVLSHGLWEELGGDPSIIGRPVRLDGSTRTVVGVMPRGFWFPEPSTRLWTPVLLDPNDRVGNFALVGRAAPGQSLARMSAPLDQLKEMLAARFHYPAQWDKTKDPAVTPIRASLVAPLRPALIATLVAMAIILLISCANVSALMLGQVEGRATELAVRSALGAHRRRLTQQLVAEAALLGVVAGGVGAGMAALSFRVLVSALPLGALAETAVPDWTLFALAMLVALLSSMAISLVPTTSLHRGGLLEAIVRGRTRGIAGRGVRMENVLVVGEVALAVVLAAGAGLLVHTVSNLYAIDPGVKAEGVGVVDVVMPASISRELRLQELRDGVAAVRALPGVQSASAVQKLPLRGQGWATGLSIEGRDDLKGVTTLTRLAAPDYFTTMGVPVRQGRVFTDADRADGRAPGADGVIVVNEALVRKYFGTESPIGRRIESGLGGWARVIGVVGNVAEATLTEDAAPVRYSPNDAPSFVPSGQVIVFRVAAGRHPAALLEAARRAIQASTPSVAVQQVTTMENVVALAVGPARQVMTLITVLTSLALVLGAIGIYGVISHFVSRRQRDWGVRIALGMKPGRVLAGIVGRGAALVLMGIAIGLPAFAVMARILSSFLYGVGRADPISLTAAVAALLSVGIVAALIPAARASRTDPANVLREQ